MKNKHRIIAAIILILVILSVLAFQIYTHTFSNFLVDENSITNFYPKGVANKYEGIIVVSTNEDHRLWKYNLNKQESESIKVELLSGVWQQTTQNELEYIYEVYFNRSLFDYTDTDKIYYCLYDMESENYMNIDIDNTLLYGQESLLFIYNKTTSKFYCVSKIVH